MSVLEYIKDKRAASPLHFTLIDPDKQSPKDAGKLAEKVKKYGSDAIMVGGSHAAQVIYLENSVKAIKEKVELPVILFPSSHSGITKYADAVFFMSLFNSRSTQYIIDEQMKGSILIKSFGIETLPMAYLIVESGSATSAGWSGDVRLLPRKKPEIAVGYGLAAKYFGMKFVYLEAGSGAEMSVPKEMVSLVKKNVGDDVYVIVGGGIRDENTAKEKAMAGADIIVTGTIAENSPDKMKGIISAVKEYRA